MPIIIKNNDIKNCGTAISLPKSVAENAEINSNKIEECRDAIIVRDDTLDQVLELFKRDVPRDKVEALIMKLTKEKNKTIHERKEIIKDTGLDKWLHIHRGASVASILSLIISLIK